MVIGLNIAIVALNKIVG